MSNATKERLHWGWPLAAALIFGAAFGVGHLIGDAPAPVARQVVEVVDATPLSQDERYKIPVSMSQPARGAADALVTVVEWCDLSGTACKQTDAVITSLQAEYGHNLRHVWRHYPTQATADSLLNHEFARIAHEQAGKFWEARSLLLQHESAVTRAEVVGMAAGLSMDLPALDKALEKRTYTRSVAADGMFAAKFGVSDVPALFVNGHRLLGAPSRERLKRLIDQEIRHAQSMLSAGVARDVLYDEITKEGLWKVAGAQ